MKAFDFEVLRLLRKRAGWSIGEVSERSGVSPAVISRLERNRATAELETVWKLARVFDLTATELLDLAESGMTRRLDASFHQSEDFHFEELRYRNVRCLFGRAPAGGRVSRPKIHRDDYEICWILRGRVRLKLPDEEYLLSAGESVQFDALLEHTYEALAESELLVIHLKKNKGF